MNILFISTELSPYAKTGGLGDAVASLLKALQAKGYSIGCVLPLYRSLMDRFKSMKKNGLLLKIHFGGKIVPVQVIQTQTDTGFPLFLVRNDAFFNRDFIYGPPGKEYPDNFQRFVFFSKAALELAQWIKPLPKILHVHDWPTALVPLLVRHLRLPFYTVLTIHNLSYQGIFESHLFGLTGLPSIYFSLHGLEFFGKINLLKGGIIFSDWLTTVSPTYALEIQNPGYGCGLEGVIKQRAYKLTGILNGVDYSLWDPKTDPYIAQNYSLFNLKGKETCKKSLLKTFFLSFDDNPLFCTLSRFIEQKGFELIIPLIRELVFNGCRFIFFGEGSSRIEKLLLDASSNYPTHVATKIGFDEILAHQIIAGADFLLMPSLFEPCGLSHLYGMKYATLPIARKTGGLADTIDGWEEEKHRGTGILFDDPTPAALLKAIKKALHIFQNKSLLSSMRKEAMKKDFSWQKCLSSYEKIYRRFDISHSLPLYLH
ncbi:glycogen synthase GlgA [Candidatus Methylacidiphilum infernorum]|uniref:Glycogen synthase n=1 Tax=Candidatus Methylacidiphilum infernorum TaxID=511746 RepID=A0ABX7PX29_9BACT|nr:glycogen synthase GlgA [Candidatus Methylacidiphilum infernorum]QSR87269.1 glycogen synthase GlgA [Candidatus Methylacidiphilum infernorum]